MNCEIKKKDVEKKALGANSPLPHSAPSTPHFTRVGFAFAFAMSNVDFLPLKLSSSAKLVGCW